MNLTPEEQFAAVLAEHIGCQKPRCIIRRADKEMLSLGSFDMAYNRIVNALAATSAEGDPVRRYRDKAALFAIGSPGMEVVRSVCYRPDGDEIIDGKFNMWTNPHIEPLAERPEIFLDHLRYLIPNKAERYLLAGWLAWIFQHPDKKVMWAILLVGRGGTGKSWLGKMMERLFGADNVVLISEEDALTSTFNGFSENKRLVFVHETPPKELAELLDKLKGLITESSILINRKSIERYKAENFANLFAVANEDVKISLTNRRWAVIRANDDPYGFDDNGRPTPAHAAYYKRLWDVIPPDGSITKELRRIAHFLQKFNIDDPRVGFDPLVAPLTGTKVEAATTDEDGMRTVAALVLEARQAREGPFRFELLTQEEVREHCGGTLGHELGEAMTEAGCRKLRRANGSGVQIYLGKSGERNAKGFTIPQRRWLWAISKTVAEKYCNTDPADIAKIYKAERDGAAEVAPMPDADTLPDFETAG